MPTPVPKQGYFRPFMLLCLGHLSGFETEKAFRFKDLLASLNGMEGIDPSWPAKTLRARIHHIMWYHHRVDCWDPPNADKLFTSAKRGLYSLTELGLCEAKGIEIENRTEAILSSDGQTLEDLTPEEISTIHGRVTNEFEAEFCPRGRNLTAEWLGEMFSVPGGMTKSPLYASIVKTVASKLPVSAASDMVEDHVQQFLLRLMDRDSLHDRIRSGQNITVSHLSTYAVRSACSDIRSMGTNPVCREIYGARTETERLKAKLNGTDDGRRWKIKDPRVSFHKDEEGLSAVLEIADEARVEVADVEAFEVFWVRMEKALKWRVPGAWPRYAKILRMKLEGGTTKEIANEMGVSTSRTTTMLSVARKILREVKDLGFFSPCFSA
jgi:hypothetical protein